MNTLTIPPSANWYEAAILACAPDNTLIYGSRNDLIVIFDHEETADVKIISRAHSQKIISVNLNRHWGEPHKLAVTVSEDKLVKLWDIGEMKRKLGNDSFVSGDRVIGAVFAGDERVIIVNESGTICIWNVILNESKMIHDLLGNKVSVTCVSTCPHASWLTAFGLRNGLVIVTDLRRNGKVIYRLRGHDKSVIALSWCPAPINVFPANPNNVLVKKEEELETKTEDTDVDNGVNLSSPKIENIEPNREEPSKEKNNVTVVEKDLSSESKDEHGQEDDLDKSFASAEEDPAIELNTNVPKEPEKIVKVNPWINLKHADDDEIQEPETADRTIEEIDDFLTECSILKDKINSLVISEQNDQEEEKTNEVNLTDRKILKPRTRTVETEIEQPRKEYLLASSAKENNIYIWRAGTDGRMQTLFTLPNKSGNQNRKNPKQSDKSWITVCWAAPTVLLASSKTSELLQLTLPKPKIASKQVRLIHKDHASNLFAIAAPIIVSTEKDWMEQIVENVWTVGQDRLLINTSLGPDRTNLSCYPTIGGSVTVMVGSPLDPTRLAIGRSDGVISLWDLSRPHKKHIMTTNFYQRIQSRVTTLSWHPTNENILSYGTIEGRIGLLTVTNTSKTPTILSQYFKNQIYHMEWGPIQGQNDNLGLYVVAEGKLVVYDIKSPENSPIVMEVPDNTFVYNAVWKPDYSKLLLSTRSGTLIVYSPDFQILQTFYIQQKFNKIVWHPTKNLFAAVTNSKMENFIIYDFDKSQKEIHVDGSFNSGHCDLVNAIAWNPFNDNQIVSAGEDGLVQIWNVDSKTVVSTYVNPTFESIFSVYWSAVDPDYLVIGLKENALKVIKISENPPMMPFKQLVEFRKQQIKSIVNETNYLLTKTENTEKLSEVKPKLSSKTCLLPKFYTYKDNIDQAVIDMERLLTWKESRIMHKFPEGNNEIFDVFGENHDMIKLLEANEKLHRSRGKHSLSGTLSLWLGNIDETIKNAIDEKRVNPWIISIAPMVSTKLWLNACETYARQLYDQSDSDPLEIATYFLACHKVNEAIDVLCENFMYREAISLSKARLCDTEIVDKIMEKWAQHCVGTGAFELAAQCYIYLKKYEQAASVLFRRSDLKLLKFAMVLADKCENEELLSAIQLKYDSFKNAGGDDLKVLVDIKTAVLSSKTEE